MKLGKLLKIGKKAVKIAKAVLPYAPVVAEAVKQGKKVLKKR